MFLRRDELHEFLRLEAAGATVLGIAALAALILANSPLQSPPYHRVLPTEGEVIVGTLANKKAPVALAQRRREAAAMGAVVLKAAAR